MTYSFIVDLQLGRPWVVDDSGTEVTAKKIDGNSVLLNIKDGRFGTDYVGWVEKGGFADFARPVFGERGLLVREVRSKAVKIEVTSSG